MADKWFRFYNSARHSRKVNGLSPICFRCWVLLLTIASEKNGAIPKDKADLSFELRMEPRRVDLALKTLVDVGLIVDCGDCYRTPDWDERQFKSDTSRERQQRYRDRHRNVTVTAQETETETETEDSVSSPPSYTAAPQRKKARTQIGDFVPDVREAIDYWLSKERPDLYSKTGADQQQQQFIDHHKARASTMADWPAAWRTWYRNAVKFNKPERTNGRSKADRPSNLDNHLEGMQLLREEIARRSGAGKG